VNVVVLVGVFERVLCVQGTVVYKIRRGRCSSSSKDAARVGSLVSSSSSEETKSKNSIVGSSLGLGSLRSGNPWEQPNAQLSEGGILALVLREWDSDRKR